ncbi:MAG: MotA/TolQ/ExbB proton channel family protein [bacterium]|nr:MotA/TolQ/ExbB proton channel family protein [bacterium]
MEFLSSFSGTLMEQYTAGGPVMHVILACSLISLATILYKSIVFYRSRSDVKALIVGVKRNVEQGRFEKACAVCEQHRGPVAIALKVGVLNCDLPRDDLERHMDGAEIHELAHLERALGVLATISSIAPLVGFFGTVVGMIVSFKALAAHGMNQPELVAEGISVALVTTAFGLLVAFFTQPFLNYFIGKVRDFENQIEIGRIALLTALGNWRRRRVVGSAQGQPS